MRLAALLPVAHQPKPIGCMDVIFLISQSQADHAPVDRPDLSVFSDLS